MPQQTFIEARTAGMAIAAAPLLRGWEEIEGEIALRYAVSGSPLQVKLAGSPLLDQLGLPMTVDSLRQECGRLGLAPVLLLHILVGSVLERADRHDYYLTISIDDLIAALGWRPQSTTTRIGMRQTIWRWILVFDAIVIIGRRTGTFRNPKTREVLDLTSNDALIRLMSWSGPESQGPYVNTPPLEFTVAAGPWLERWRGQRDILTYFGEVRRLASIPAGRPSGAWAQSIGLALQQLWRQRAKRAVVARVGEDKKVTVCLDTVTRRQLLGMFPPSPCVDDILSGPNPKRAKVYWHEAIKLLRRMGVIGSAREHEAIDGKRIGWTVDWLDQAIDIRPAGQDILAVVEIAGRFRATNKQLRERRIDSSTQRPQRAR